MIDSTAPTITFTAASNGWINTPTGVPYQCTNDDGSVSNYTAPVVVGPDGQTTATGTCTDQAGNVTSQSIPVSIDTGVPTIDPVFNEPVNAQGWSTGPVTVTFQCTDPGTPTSASGVATCSDPVTVTQEGTTAVTGVATDRAGNINEVTVFVSIDSTKPTIEYVASPILAENGWNTGDVTITFTCTDNANANQSGIASCSGPITVTADGEQNVVGTAVDVAGNVQTVAVPVRLDKTAPAIGYTLNPAPNAQGWNNGPVTVTFACEDAASGVVTCTEPVPVSQEGASIVTGTAVDAAGNMFSVNVFVYIDFDQPSITHTVSPVPNADGWNNTDATVGFQCVDVVSPILSCTNSHPETFATDGIYTATGIATDSAGNTQQDTATVKLDKTAPLAFTPEWSTSSLFTNGTTTLTVPASDNLSGLVRAEYYIGDTDPGEGNGATMALTNHIIDGTGAVLVADATTSFDGSAFQPGTYPITVRVQDKAGNWSFVRSHDLVVIDPSGPVDLGGSRQVRPAAPSVLPGMPGSPSDKALLSFKLLRQSDGNLDTNSNVHLNYAVGNACKSHPERCLTTTFNATMATPNTISSFVYSGADNKSATVEGIGTLQINDHGSVVTTQHAFRLVATDNGTQVEPATIYIYQPGTAPAQGQIQYQLTVSGADWLALM